MGMYVCEHVCLCRLECIWVRESLGISPQKETHLSSHRATHRRDDISEDSPMGRRSWDISCYFPTLDNFLNLYSR